MTTPSEISYETPSEAESTPSPSGASTPGDVSEDSDSRSNNSYAALALVNLFHARPDDGLSSSHLLDIASITEAFPATSIPIAPAINTPKAGSPTASDREATPMQSSHQIPMTMKVDDTCQVPHQTNYVDLVDEEDSSSDGSSVLEICHEMEFSDSGSDTGSVITVQEQNHDEAVDNLRPGLLNLAVVDERMDAELPTVLFPESGPDGPLPTAPLEAHSPPRRRASGMTAKTTVFDSAADPVIYVAPGDDEDRDQNDDRPPRARASSVQENNHRTETTALSHYGQQHPRPMTNDTVLIYGIPKNAEIDSTESLSGDSSVVEIDREEMMYSSDSSDSSIETIDARSYSLAIRLSQAATNWALFPSQKGMAQEMKNRTLRAVARAGHTYSVQRLIVKGADIHSRSKSGMMALHTAALHGHVQVVGLLLQLGSDVDETVRGSVEIPYKYSDTRKVETLRNPDSLQLACSKGHQDVAELLLTHQPSRIDRALFYAAFFGIDPIVRMLLDWDNETKRLNGIAKERALCRAVLHDYWTTVELLLSGVDSYDNVELGAVLMLAIVEGKREVCELLLNRGVDMKYRNGNGDTPLTLAIEMGEIDIVKAVLAASSGNLDYHSYGGDTPLTMAVSENRRDIVKLLLDGGASIEYRSAHGDTALILAVWQGMTDVVELLLSRGANMEYRAENGDTALTYAISHKQAEIATLLVDNGADVHHRASGGDTPLTFAYRTGDEYLVKLLDDKGATVL